jgi:hypothetical protein
MIPTRIKFLFVNEILLFSFKSIGNNLTYFSLSKRGCKEIFAFLCWNSDEQMLFKTTVVETVWFRFCMKYFFRNLSNQKITTEFKKRDYKEIFVFLCWTSDEKMLFKTTVVENVWFRFCMQFFSKSINSENNY